jgi:hypothetical protein
MSGHARGGRFCFNWERCCFEVMFFDKAQISPPHQAKCTPLRPRHVNPKISPVDRIPQAPWGLSGGSWWLPLSHQVVGAPEPPSVTSVSAQETTSSICVHGGEVPRGSGLVGSMAPGGAAEHAGAQTPHELQWGPWARLPGRQGLPGGSAKNGYFCKNCLAKRESM